MSGAKPSAKGLPALHGLTGHEVMRQIVGDEDVVKLLRRAIEVSGLGGQPRAPASRSMCSEARPTLGSARDFCIGHRLIATDRDMPRSGNELDRKGPAISDRDGQSDGGEF